MAGAVRASLDLADYHESGDLLWTNWESRSGFSALLNLSNPMAVPYAGGPTRSKGFLARIGSLMSTEGPCGLIEPNGTSFTPTAMCRDARAVEFLSG